MQAIKRSTLKIGMIPADGVGREVLPVRTCVPSRVYNSGRTRGNVRFLC